MRKKDKAACGGVSLQVCHLVAQTTLLGEISSPKPPREMFFTVKKVFAKHGADLHIVRLL